MRESTMKSSVRNLALSYCTKDEIGRVLADYSPDTRPSRDAQRMAAVAMVLSGRGEEGVSALFIKRAEHPRDPWSGQMAFPGGRLEPGDASLEAAARRETAEELGLTLTPAMCMGRLDDLAAGRLRAFGMTVSPFVYWCPGSCTLTPNGEVSETVWIPLSFLANPGNVCEYVFPQDPLARKFPAFQYGPYTIWGLTYRMLANFMALWDIPLPAGPLMTEVE